MDNAHLECVVHCQSASEQFVRIGKVVGRPSDIFET